MDSSKPLPDKIILKISGRIVEPDLHYENGPFMEIFLEKRESFRAESTGGTKALT
jgi:hypothetical protein